MRKNFFRLKSVYALPLLCALVAGFSFVMGCGKFEGKKLGVDIPRDAAVVELASILEEPAEYDGKSVVVKGIIAGQCASLCEFFLKDGMQRATIFPQGYKFPKLPKGKPVTVYAQVTSGEGQVVFSALGVRVD
jgi:hypothetical protein